ncbi:hypothetical protein ACJX0J_007358, partial [Zea mays]
RTLPVALVSTTFNFKWEYWQQSHYYQIYYQIKFVFYYHFHLNTNKDVDAEKKYQEINRAYMRCFELFLLMPFFSFFHPCFGLISFPGIHTKFRDRDVTGKLYWLKAHQKKLKAHTKTEDKGLFLVPKAMTRRYRGLYDHNSKSILRL